MPIFNIPIDRPRRLLNASDQLKAKKARAARAAKAAKARAAKAASARAARRTVGDTSIPLNMKLARFANRPLKPAGDSSRTELVDLKTKAAWWKVSTTGNENMPGRKKTMVTQVSKTSKAARTSRAAKVTKEVPKVTKEVPKVTKEVPKVTKEVPKVPEVQKVPKVLFRIESKNVNREQKTINKGEIAQFSKNNVKMATILPPNPSLNRTLKVTGLSEAELNKALKIAAAKTKNTILKDITKNMMQNLKK